MSCRHIPDLTLLRPFPFLTSSRFPTSTLIPDPMLFDLLSFLCQVHSQHFIGLATAVGQSPVTYLPRSMCLSLSFPALYISVCSSTSANPGFRHSNHSTQCLLNLYHHHPLWESPSPHPSISVIAVMQLAAATSPFHRLAVAFISYQGLLSTWFSSLPLFPPGFYTMSRQTPPPGPGSSGLAQGLALS